MAAYALALFFWGMLGDRLDPKKVVAAGMVGSAITVGIFFYRFFLFKKLFLSFQLTMFGTVPKWLNFYSVPYYIFTYILFGLVQACGWPSEIAIMVISSPKRSAKTISISGELVWEGQSWFCDGRVGRLPACR